jgi:hypothetical protein
MCDGARAEDPDGAEAAPGEANAAARMPTAAPNRAQPNAFRLHMSPPPFGIRSRRMSYRAKRPVPGTNLCRIGKDSVNADRAVGDGTQ